MELTDCKITEDILLQVIGNDIFKVSIEEYIKVSKSNSKFVV